MKNKLTKMLSMVLVIAMLLSAMTFTANASATALIDEDFEYADTAAAIAAGWVNTNNNATLSATEFVAVTNGDSHGKSMKITKNSDNSGTKHAIDGALTTGKYKVSLSAYVDKELVVRVNYGESKNYALNFSPSGNKIYGLDGAYAEALWQSNVWADIEILFDLDAGKAYVTITNADTKQVILSAKEYSINKNIQINGIEFITWNTAVSYVDDLSITPYTDAEEGGGDGDGEGDEEATGELTDDFEYADVAAAIAAGWVNTNSATTLGTTDFVAVSNGDVHGKSMKITKNTDNSGTKHIINGAATTGKYKVKLSAYIDKELVVRVNYGTSNYALNFSPSGNKIYGLDGAYAEALWQSNVWMDIEILFDLDAGKVYVTITNADTKQVILTAKEYTIDKNIQINGVEFITWNAASSYVDDLSVAPYVVNLNKFADNFEYADTAAAIAAGWVNTNNNTTLSATEFVAVTNGDSHGKSMKITKNSDNSGTKVAIADMETTGKYKVKMSVYIENELVARVKYGTNGMYVLNFSNNGMLYVNDATGQINTEKSYLRNAWNDIEMLFDLNTGVWDVKITNINGEFHNEDFSIDKNIQINGLEFITWQTGNSYIDDVSIDRYFAAPAPKITMTDIKGAMVDVSKAVTPGIKTIAIDFGESMLPETLDGAVTFDGVVTSGVFDSANQIYTITRTEALSEGTHTIAVADSVKNVNGEKMELAYSLEFTVGQAMCEVILKGLYDVPMGQSLAFEKKPVTHTIVGSGTTGSYTLKYSYKNGNDFNVLVTVGNIEESIVNIGANNATFVDGQWQGANANTARNTWYNVEVVFTYSDTALNYTVTIKDQNGNAIINEVAGSIASAGAVTLLKFTSWNDQTDLNYLDNVWFGPTGGAALLEDNFNTYDDENAMQSAGWAKLDTAGDWKLERIIDESNKIDAFNSLAAGKNLVIKAEYVNPGVIQDAVFVVAYYNDDKLVDLDVINAENGLKAFDSDEIIKNTEVTDEAFDEINVFCWDSMLTMSPYCVPLSFVGE